MDIQYDLLLKNGQVFLSEGLVEADIGVLDGKIAALFLRGEGYTAPSARECYDVSGKAVLPGAIDPHVHIRAPDRPDREDFFTGTAAAANGGVTTILEQPISNPPQYSIEILDKRIAAAVGTAMVDFAFYGAAGAKYPDKIRELAESGKVVAFKTFLHEAPPGRDAEFNGLTMENDAEQFAGMTTIGECGVVCGVHAENNDMINAGIKAMKAAGKIKGSDHARSRLPITEYETVSKLILFAELTGARIYFCHISTPEAMEMIRDAKSRGLDLYLETCPHYLLMDESYLDKYGTFAKCNPPLRVKEEVEKLWKYVNDGTVDFIGSDHAPYTYEERLGGNDNIFDCPAGIPSIEMRVPLMLNAVNDGKLSLKKMVELVSTNVAKVFSLYPRKGEIEIGADADFTVVDMNESYTIDINKQYTKSRKTAVVFDGMKLKGAVKATIVRGRIIMENGKVNEECRGYGEFQLPIKRDAK